MQVGRPSVLNTPTWLDNKPAHQHCRSCSQSLSARKLPLAAANGRCLLLALHRLPPFPCWYVLRPDVMTPCPYSTCHLPGAGSDLGGEYARQRTYLEKTIEGLKRKLAADAEAHRSDELRIMSQNVSLIRELNELRREIKVRGTDGLGGWLGLDRRVSNPPGCLHGYTMRACFQHPA